MKKDIKYHCRLRVIFAEREIKHGKFAKKVGISGATLSALVNEHQDPSFDTAYAICEELQLTIQEIWIRKQKKPPTN